MRTRERVFVDTGAWIALALTRDPLHPRAAETWALLQASGAQLHTSVPVAVETFTFLDRNTTRADRKSTRLNSSHSAKSRMPSSA